MLTGVKELKKYFHQIYFDISQSYKVKITAIILFILGIFLIFYSVFSDSILFKDNAPLPNLFLISNIKIGLMLFFMGIFMFLFFPKNSIQQRAEFYTFFFLTGWLFIMVFIGIDTRTNFFLFTVVGILICKELVNGYLTPSLKKKLSILTLVLFSMSMILIVVKIINDFHLFP